jgi:predicted DNA-binding transcriptional regulator YafY
MGQTERLHKIKTRLDAGQSLTRAALLAEFEISAATLKRDIAYLRDRLRAPVVYDRACGGWRLDRRAQPHGAAYAMGLSLREDEIHALLAMQQMLADLAPGGLLRQQFAPLQQRLVRLLEKGLASPPADTARRIRVLAQAARRVPLPQFQAVAHALLARKRLRIVYRARADAETSERQVSPQRLVHYRDNWYCDAWCHRREGLRIFSVDAMAEVQVLDVPAQEMHDADLDDLLTRGYGIFAGRAVHRARLRFSAERSRWVAGECWHPDQRGRLGADGRWVLDVPYADPRELVMDILRHVPHVEVMWPQELADEVRQRLVAGLHLMDGGAG